MMLGVTFALLKTLYFTLTLCIMITMLAGPSKRAGQLVAAGRAHLPTSARSYASSSKGKSVRKQFEPVIFTGIQPTGLSTPSICHYAPADPKAHLTYDLICQ